MEKKRTYGVWAVRSSTSIFGPAQSWCKENGKPLEFDSKADAENYAKEANEHTTANVRYYVKEKEPEPGAVRKGTSQPELDARSHEEVIPRNDAAEKQNEIPGILPGRDLLPHLGRRRGRRRPHDRRPRPQNPTKNRRRTHLDRKGYGVQIRKLTTDSPKFITKIPENLTIRN